MTKPESSISKADSYEAIGRFWDQTDLYDTWDRTKPVEFEVELDDDVMLCRMPRDISEQIRAAALAKGLAPSELLKSWIRERLQRPE